ncbi:MAG: cytochrome c biogenesis protein CcsA [Promethearchaeota archaeon]|nr:MAG: cytochrome c biogenesis protein CcsA [Candidatus Lokiarchaeota archaeon]
MEKIKSPKNYKYFVLYFIFTLIAIFFIFLQLLNLLEWDVKIDIIALFGNSLIISIIIITVIDLINLLTSKKSLFLLPFLNMTLSIILFLLMIYCFINDYFDIVYVWSNSNISQPLVYKIVAIWAGQSGSIMTWMVFNSIVLFFYRIKTQVSEIEKKYDPVYILSCSIGLIILIIFLLILFFQMPFRVEEPYILPEGSGLNPVLLSPFMIWHPFFTFVAYAIFLIPFSIIISESILLIRRKIMIKLKLEEPPKYELSSPYQKAFLDFALKFGWLVMTLSIAFGAYWASVTLSWGRYWGWDPVETVSLLPWLYCTAYFHSFSFRKLNSKIYKFNTILIFLSVVFSTLISRGGGVNSLHTFVGPQELLFWVLLTGAILLIITIYILDKVLSHVFEDYKNTRLFLDYISYFFIFALSFVLILGLFVPPLSYFLSRFIPIDPIYIGADFYNVLATILALGLAISLIYCSLYNDYKIKSITIAIIGCIIIGILIGVLINYVLVAIIIYFVSGLASIISIVNHLNDQKGLKHFFRVNSKKIIHLGISLILMGTLTGKLIITDIFFLLGFIILLLGIFPSIVIVFLRVKQE